MKTPRMSAWFSAANRMAAANCGLMTAETSRKQIAMTRAWMETATQTWVGGHTQAINELE